MSSMVYEVVNGASQFHRRGLFVLLAQLLGTNEVVIVVELIRRANWKLLYFGFDNRYPIPPITKKNNCLAKSHVRHQLHIDDETREK